MVDLLSKGASLPDEQQNIRLRRTVNQLTRATLKPFSDNGLRLFEPGGHKNRQRDIKRNIVGANKLSTLNVVCVVDRQQARIPCGFFKKKIRKIRRDT